MERWRVGQARKSRAHGLDQLHEERQGPDVLNLGPVDATFNRRKARFAQWASQLRRDAIGVKSGMSPYRPVRGATYSGLAVVALPLRTRRETIRERGRHAGDEQVHPSEEWSTRTARRRLKYVGLRPASPLPSEALRGRLADLVRQRQALRDELASTSMLEQNRLAIVQAQLELARTLVSEHADPVA
jgi:hypothetical protein